MTGGWSSVSTCSPPPWAGFLCCLADKQRGDGPVALPSTYWTGDRRGINIPEAASGSECARPINALEPSTSSRVVTLPPTPGGGGVSQRPNPHPHPREGPPRNSPPLSSERSVCLVLTFSQEGNFILAAAFHISRSLSGNLDWTDFSECSLPGKAIYTYIVSGEPHRPTLQPCGAGKAGPDPCPSPGNQGSDI